MTRENIFKEGVSVILEVTVGDGTSELVLSWKEVKWRSEERVCTNLSVWREPMMRCGPQCSTLSICISRSLLLVRERNKSRVLQRNRVLAMNSARFSSTRSFILLFLLYYVQAIKEVVKHRWWNALNDRS